MAAEASAITRDDVARARAELIEAGKRPSQRAVLGVLGRGSFSTIGPWLRELEAETARAERGAPVGGVTEPLEAAVRDAVARTWKALGTEADDVVQRARRGFEQELSNAHEARDRATAASERVRERLQDVSGRLEEVRAELAATASELDRVRREHMDESVAHARLRARTDGLEALAGERLAALERTERERRAAAERAERLDAELRAEREGRAAERRAADVASREAGADHARALAERDARLASSDDELDRARTALERVEAALAAERDGGARLRERLDERDAAARDERAAHERRNAALEATVAALERERESLERAASVRLADRDDLLAALAARGVPAADGVGGGVRGRAASPADAPVLRAIAGRAYDKYVPRMDRRPAPLDADYDAAVASGAVQVIEGDDGVLGYVVVREADGALLLENMAVAPEHAGRGHGRRLVELAEARARELGLARIELYTNAAMVENLELYRHLGFVETGRREEDGFDRVFFARER